MTGGFGSQGASTLTQQVVKRAFLSEEKSIGRKAQEAYLSYRLEQEYSKDEIFQMYLNKIYYSDGVYGVKAAAKYYFNKDLKDLNLAEEAYLAGLHRCLTFIIFTTTLNKRKIVKHCTLLNALSQQNF